MDPLQLQLLLMKLKEKASIGPDPVVMVPDGLGSSVPLPGKRHPDVPVIGPASVKPGLTNGMAVPDETGMVAASMMPEQGVELPPVSAPKMSIPSPDVEANSDDIGAINAGGTGMSAPEPIRTDDTVDKPVASGKELPYQTYERLTGQKWTGGRSKSVQDILRRLGITAMPGSPEANMALQKALLGNAAGIQE